MDKAQHDRTARPAVLPPMAVEEAGAIVEAESLATLSCRFSRGMRTASPARTRHLVPRQATKRQAQQREVQVDAGQGLQDEGAEGVEEGEGAERRGNEARADSFPLLQQRDEAWMLFPTVGTCKTSHACTYAL